MDYDYGRCQTEKRLSKLSDMRENWLFYCAYFFVILKSFNVYFGGLLEEKSKKIGYCLPESRDPCVPLTLKPLSGCSQDLC